MAELLIQLVHLSKIFGSRPLFDELSLSIHAGERLALIGENGAGKTSLLKIMLGTLEKDSGTIVKKESLTVGYLPQEISPGPVPQSVREYLEESPLKELEIEMEKCLQDSCRLSEWGELHDRFDKMGGYRREPLEPILEGLKIDGTLLDKPMGSLSSGQRVLVALAKALLEDPDLLLLDEPTNHLDNERIFWLAERLRGRLGASLIVSHDRSFLNAACNRLLELKDGKLTLFGGAYDFYLEEKKRLLELSVKAFEEREEEMRSLRREIKMTTFSSPKATPPKDNNKMGYDYRGGNYQKSQKRNIGVMKKRLEELEISAMRHPRPKGITGIVFDSSVSRHPVALEFVAVTKSFAGKAIVEGFSKVLKRQGRALLKGANGTGKSTLLKMAAGKLDPDQGSVYRPPGSRIAYLDQEGEIFPMHETPLSFFQREHRLSPEELIRELHKADLGGQELVERPFHLMSAGQRKRIMILDLILARPDTLLLDEPTNHLDLKTLEALEKALLLFDGTILAVSHDSAFIKKLGAEIWELSPFF